ncbi:DNA replication/repair protein RecF [Synechococcus sp. PCC 7336]|uniref:DNA replication/repair protein RecF n=1 Tax=Synechococcus sp. PCC 7336 TaxID=195250 RepID=UPI0003482D92|nr:DNA replication/repair protein RecF [Synechococcus sp. PCC 7336]
MYLRSLHLRHFRNYTDQLATFESPKTILVGDNAQGKSNLLEAVELLATLASHRANRDREFVQNTHPVGALAAELDRHGTLHELSIDLRAQGRRSLRVDGQLVRRRAEFLGQLNAVNFSSLDLDLVRGSPSTRRDWLDGILLQLEPVYGEILDQYRQVLKQRNALLKSPTVPNESTLAAWNAQLVATGTRAIRRRSRLLQRLQPLASQWHAAISGDRETLRVTYEPQVAIATPNPTALEVEDVFWQAIAEKTTAERLRGTSLVGPHRDDVQLIVNDAPARQYGSQGQQRTLVLSLKLAELELIETVVGDSPLLLLDDVLAELDLQRQDRLLDAIGNRVQTLVTATHLGNFDARWLDAAQIVTVRQGSLDFGSS